MRVTLTILAFGIVAMPASAADLVLAANGKSNYQIVVPDKQPTSGLQECLAQTARLIQVAFKANGTEVEVVAESRRDASKPSLMLGNTNFAQKNGIDVTKLRDWSYVHRAIGQDVIIAGHDHASRVKVMTNRGNWDRVGTSKAAVDFARQYMGVRFLFPELAGYTPVGGAAKIDLLTTPALEFLPLKTIAVPDTLNVARTPMLRVNTSHPAGGSFYDLAHNRFPRVDEQFGGHTWERAVPVEEFARHPEYFAMISGSRQKPEGGRAQYCLSNPEVRERIYRDLAGQFDNGFHSVDLGQPDGFRECQCEKCEALHGTSKNWSEKIWITHREIAERLEKSHPGKQVTMMSYILTAEPPKTFQAFPANTSIMLTGTNEDDFTPWRDIKVPLGFTGYVYNWCPNLGTRYTPMRTPGHIELQVQRLAANQIQSLYRDGPGQLFGLEGPVYYTMGRMFDDPKNNHARDLIPEFCDAAYPNKSIAFYMRAFYDELYSAIALYSDHLGTRNDVWTFKLLPTDPRGRKTVTDPFQLIAFLYTPRVLMAMEAHLAQSERLSTTPKIKARLGLVRTEFDYLKHMAHVVHLHQAYQVLPDAHSLQRLLDAIDARNAFITKLYDRGHQKEWNHVLFPFPGHDAKHLRLAYDGYQEPYANTCFNWDTKAMRNAPAIGSKKLTITKTTAKLTFESAEWKNVTAHELTLIPPLHTLPRKTIVKLFYDDKALYIRAVAELGDESQFKAFNRDSVLTNQEAFDLYLAPQPGQRLYYRFTQGTNPASKYDAVNGRIANALDPRFGKDDPTWNGDWTSETVVDSNTKRWHAYLVIPFSTLGVETPAKGISWKANFGRTHLLPRGMIDRAIWSSSQSSTSMDDTTIMGEIAFE